MLARWFRRKVRQDWLVAQQEVLRHQSGAVADGGAEQREEEQQALDHQRHDRRNPTRSPGLLDPYKYEPTRGQSAQSGYGPSTQWGESTAPPSFGHRLHPGGRACTKPCANRRAQSGRRGTGAAPAQAVDIHTRRLLLAAVRKAVFGAALATALALVFAWALLGFLTG